MKEKFKDLKNKHPKIFYSVIIFVISIVTLFAAGPISGPATSTVNAIPRYSGTDGKILKNSSVTIDDSANIGNANSFDVVTVNTAVLNPTNISFYASLPNDDLFQGFTIAGLNNNGGVTQWDVVYLNSSSQWVLADANGSGTYPAIGLATATATTGNATTIIINGIVRNDAWNWTPGGTIYLSATAGELTQTAPSTTDDKIQVIGFALTADIMFVKPSSDYGTSP